MLKFLRKIKDYLILKRSGLFDEEYYCLQYPDVRQADVNPLWHFVNIGWLEKRNPSKEFVTDYYLNMNPDVQKSRINPLIHFFLFGRDEGRLPNNFSALKDISFTRDLSIEDILTIKPVNKKNNKTHPLVDIVIYAHNESKSIQACLESIVQNTSTPYRIIIVDDYCNNSEAHYLQYFASSNPNVILHINQEGIGFIKSVNIGVSLSTAFYIAVITSDIVVCSGWLERLLSPMEDNNVGISCPISNNFYWYHTPKLLGMDGFGIPFSGEYLPLTEFAIWVQKFAKPIHPEVSLLNRNCLLIRKALILDIGRFVEDTLLAGYNPLEDYFVRANNKGWKLILCDDVFVHYSQSIIMKDSNKEHPLADSSKIVNEKNLIDIGQNSEIRNKAQKTLQGLKIHGELIPERIKLIKQGKENFSGKKILFVLPITAPGGGANVIFSEALSMENMGVQVSIFNKKEFEPYFDAAYPNCRLPVYFDDPRNLRYYAPDFDAIIATVNFTVEWLLDLANIRNLILGYYIQGFEPLIYSADSPDYMRALDSYTLIPTMKGFCKTAWTQREVYKACNLKVPQIGISVDVDKFQPSPKKTNNSSIRIAAMVRPSTLYRMPEETMKLLSRAKKCYENIVDIVIFGCTNEEIDNSQLPHDFAYQNAGVLNPDQVSALLNESDIFIDYSSHQAMGLTILEAMTLGLATLVPLNGGAVEYSIDRKNALIFDPSSFEDAWSKLSELIDNNHLRNKISSNAMLTGNSYYPEKSAINILKVLFDN